MAFAACEKLSLQADSQQTTRGNQKAWIIKNMSDKIRKIVLISLLALSVIGLFVFSCSFFAIYRSVKGNCLKAQDEYQEDCVGSLIRLVTSEDKTFREKNSAIWALGQLADKKVLSFLYELEKSLPEQEKCSYDNYLCKYEVQKAIKWCEKGNVTNWMYRNRENWR